MEFMNPRIIIRVASWLERSHDVHFIVTLRGAVEVQSDSTRYARDMRIKEFACNSKWDVRLAVRHLQANIRGITPQVIWEKPKRKKARKQVKS